MVDHLGFFYQKSIIGYVFSRLRDLGFFLVFFLCFGFFHSLGWFWGRGTYFSQLRVQHGCVNKVFEGALFRLLDRRVNHVEAHDGLPVRKRRFDVVDDGRVLDDPLRFLGQTKIGADDFGVGVLLLEALLGLGRVADQAEAAPFFGDDGEERRGLFAAGAGDDEQVRLFVDGGGDFEWHGD